MITSKFLNLDTDSSLTANSDDRVSSQKALKTYIDNADATKQDTLVSGTNIKTINNTSILGSGNISVSTSTDNKSITLNTSDQIQSVGVIDQNNTTNAIKTWTGTKAQYDAIATKDNTTFYAITDAPSSGYTAGDGIKIENDTISFDGTTIPGYSEDDSPRYLQYYHGDGYTFIGFGEAPIPAVGNGLNCGDDDVIKLDLRQYATHTEYDELTGILNKEILCFSSFPGYFSPDITLGASGSYFDFDTCGWFAVWVTGNPSNKDLFIRAELNDTGDGHLVHLRSDGKFPSLLIPKQKEQLLYIYHNFDSTIGYTCKNIQPEHYKS